MSAQDLDPKLVLKRALLELKELKARLAAVEGSALEPVAVVGIGCRFPGGADTPERFWELLRAGSDATREIPPQRWDVDAFYDPDPDAPGKMYTRRGGFLETVDQFAASFFGISPREAVGIDPQQRLLLEVAWEALEDACIPPDGLVGSRTGVFLGITNTDYMALQAQHIALDEADIYAASGGALNFAAGRLSFAFGLQGPSLAVDTACSSSLVAVHLACHSLRAKESELALAAGVNLILTPAPNVVLSRARMLAADGRCKTFDAAADGYGRGEGCGVVVLKRASDAVRDGDRILALIRGSAVNQDGPGSGLTVPNGAAQQEVVRAALKSAGIEPDELGYVEAHGTGTALGDPIELRALAAVLDRRPRDRPLAIGSVKTNIGHLEAAAGIAGLIKVVLALEHRELPAHVGLKQRNTHLDWHALPLWIPTAHTGWNQGSARRVAGVSSFGISGTNAHVVLEEAPERAAPRPASTSPGAQLLVLSAKSERALAMLAQRHAERLRGDVSCDLRSLCFSLNTGRAQMPHRLAIVGDSAEEIADKLAAYAEQGAISGARVRSGRAPRSGPPRVAFLFTGQGSLYAGAGRALFDSEPVFRRALERCQEILGPELEVPLCDLLFQSDKEALERTDNAQPVLFALQWALAELWRHWGVTPDAVLGHSVGELSAACIAGVFSVEDGLRLIAERGRLMQRLTELGKMVAVFAPVHEVEAELENAAEPASLAALNGPEEAVISGAPRAVTSIAERFAARGFKTKALSVSRGFHSPLMLPMLEAFAQAASRVAYAEPCVEIISNVTGKPIGSAMASAEYWREHVLAPVRFLDGIRSLDELGVAAYLELGAKPVLLGLARRCLPDREALWLPSLREGNERREALNALAALYVRGRTPNLRAVAGAEPGPKLRLPRYPFERERYWIDTSRRLAPEPHVTPGETDPEPLVPRRVSSPFLSGAAVFEKELSLAALPLLRDHRVRGLVIVSGVVQLAMVEAALQQLGVSGRLWLEDVSFSEPLVIPELGGVLTHIELRLREDGGWEFQISSRDAADARASSPLRNHTRGRARNAPADASSGPARTLDLQALIARCPEQQSGAAFYEQLSNLERHDIGPGFQCIERLWRGDGEALCEIRLPPDTAELTASEQGSAWLLRKSRLGEVYGQVLKAALPRLAAEQVYIGLGVRELREYALQRSERLLCYARVQADALDPDLGIGDVCLLDGHGVVLAEAEALQMRRVASAALAVGDSSPRRARQRARWSPAQLQGRPTSEYAAVLEGYVRAQLAHVLDRAEIDDAGDASLRDLGVDSLIAVELKENIEADLGVAPALVELIQGPTLSELGARLASLLAGGADARPGAQPLRATAAAGGWLIRHGASATCRARLLCLPYGGGGASSYDSWAAQLGPDVELCAVQLPGRESRIQEAPIAELEPLLHHVVEHIEPLLDRPFALFGASMGALVAFELARRLRREKKRTPALLFAAAFPAPHLDARALADVFAKLAFGPDGAGGRALADSWQRSPELREALLAAWRADHAIVERYRFREEPALQCPIFALAGVEDTAIARDALVAWHRHTEGRFALELFHGGHLFIDQDGDRVAAFVARALAPLTQALPR